MTRSILAFALSVGIGACSGTLPPQNAGNTPSEEHLPGGITILHLPDNSSVATDQSGHGAVLCAWTIYVAIQYVGKTCFPEDKQTQSLLAEEIERIDRFIMANAPATREQVERRKANDLSAEGSGQLLQCGNEQWKWLEDSYTGMQANPQKLRAEIDDLLSVPRQPVLNPCL
jgi:hypothetical protein